MTYDLNRLINWCVGATGLFILSEVIYGTYAAFLYQFYVQVENGAMGFAEQSAYADQLDSWGVFIGLGYTGITILAFVLNGMWLYRASYNAWEFDPNGDRIRPAMAVIWYVVPFAHLVMPYRSMKQTYNSSLQPPEHLNRGLPGYFVWWWITWLCSATLANISTQIFLRDDSLDAAKTSSVIDVLTSPISIVAALLFIKIMRKVTELQAEKGHNNSELIERFA